MTTPVTLKPLVLAEASSASGVTEGTLAMAVALALLPGGPDTAAPGWWDDAPCAGLDTNQFFPSRGGDTRRLRAICGGCPVRAACLGSALYNGEQEGWWGGTSGAARRRLRKVLRTAGIMGVIGEDAYLAWSEDDRVPPDLVPTRYVTPVPWPHQLGAVSAITGALEAGGRCQVATATAAGKTHVALWAANSLGVQRVLVLVPSLALIAQTADVWAADPRWAAARRLAVCSDTGELDLDATTDPAVVQEFMNGPGPGIVLGTYHSSDVLVAAARRFDLTVADEAHHLAGESDKAFAPILRGEIPSDRTLFMTATPRRFRHLRRRSDDAELIGMDDEVFGPQVFDFPLSEAVAAGVVADNRVIVAAVEKGVFERVAALPEMEGIDSHLLVGAIAVVRAMGEMHLGSCVSFQYPGRPGSHVRPAGRHRGWSAPWPRSSTLARRAMGGRGSCTGAPRCASGVGCSPAWPTTAAGACWPMPRPSAKAWTCRPWTRWRSSSSLLSVAVMTLMSQVGQLSDVTYMHGTSRRRRS